ncbi:MULTISPECIES: FtsW/RodA/SpoVE family cell cycle protein [Rhodococcus]|uniref:FtsW/RodA/SpoVE family cell cycle protein n=1 Tax=Rhodococcus TaxID=1827 RepID=UPI002954C690|nr:MULTISPECIES: FtsW/RodA/SpoVE family cell cycle protein [Rhodococcus]MDV7242600.1 FtsW/RodA/SpoVE family cell cycle protein [Rhodococcus oxybenzonivorans]MDV7276032.1 FtsW/RodA/SpoVE family cell cycle protein [Rhodococcus oxybenzonivorans]MDV7332089.1 FtsW/RodA/SpoVE family cell cycle protein [Rhodococcus oxybenzonivorans]MDV8027182.1 FtsW/RodA/SpoVE family cell cycle protein [Rhodococcus sp. IEGM 27]MDV8102745.1 FtsW/RodA/SpoVE family cell cycle protein [Rhodococcus sp. IEGM 69]
MHEDKRESDPWIVTAAVVLVVLGLLNLTSTGMTSHAVRHALFAAAGLGLMRVASRLRMGDLRAFGWAIFTVTTAMLAAVPLAGVATKGAQRWLDFGIFTIQPSELAKLAVILVAAGLLAAGFTLGRFVATLAVVGIPVALVALQPDLSTAVVLVVTAGFMLVLARVPLLPLLPLFMLGIASLPLAVLFLRPYQLERVHVFLSSNADPSGAGWAEMQANIAIGSGGLWGLSRDPLFEVRAEYLPESEHDLAFASLVYGWGLIAGIAVVVASSVIVWRAALAARTARTREAALVAAGVGGLFGIHALVSIGASLSLLPHNGMPIPLFSYGGTAAIVGFVAVGLVLAVRRDGVARPLWAPEPRRRRRPRGLSVGAVTVTALLVAMSLFTWQLQHDRGADLRAMSDQQMMRCIRLPAERGLVVDRNGVPLAVNVAEYAVAVVARMFDENDAGSRRRLASVLGISPEEVTSVVRERGEGEQDVVVGTVAPEVARRVVDARLPGVLVVPSGRRHYPYGAVLASVLGHVGVADEQDMERWPHLALGSRVGKAGLEKQYDALLRGSDGKQCVYVDPSGHPVATGERVDPVRGHDLRLHLDVGVQNLATDALTEAMRKSRGDLGAAIVMDARNGAVLAMASVPGFDNNVYGPPADLVALTAQAQTPGPSPLLNNVTQTAVPPGSTFKIVVAAANTQYPVLAPETVIETGAAYTYGGHTFRNWQPMGPHNLLQAIQWSDNVYFYKLGELLGPENIAAVADQLGVGRRSGIDLPGEAEGFLGTPANVGSIGATWYPGSTLLMGIGQGTVTATPIQVARWTSGIATGAMVTPQLAAGYGPDVVPIPTAEPVRLPFADRLDPVRAGMRASAAAGTAGQLAELPVPAGAKTGTAEDPSAPGEGLNAWFSAVAPFDAPQIVVSVLVRGGGFGSATSGPVVKKILEHYFPRPPGVLPIR